MKLQSTKLKCSSLMLLSLLSLLALLACEKVEAAAATKLAITSVNGGLVHPNTSFTAFVEAQDNAGATGTIATDTTVFLILSKGSGVLSGTITKVITVAGANPISINGGLYDTAEAGVVITAIAVSGDNLAPGSSAPLNFTNTSGPAALKVTLSSPSVFAPFSATVSSVTSQGFAVNLGLDTNFTLQLASGAGTLGGTVSGTILQSTNTVILNNITYNRAEPISVTGFVTSGQTLTPGTALANVAGGPVTMRIDPGYASTTAPFAITVNSIDAAGTPAAVSVDTPVTLSRQAGTGVLGGTLTGTIVKGSSAVAIGGVSYTVAENGVALTAAATGGEALAAANSALFSVSGPAAKLAVAVSGASSLNVPFQVLVSSKDANGNAANAGVDTAFTLSIKTGGGALHGVFTGTLLAGTNQTLLRGVAYSQADAIVVLTAARTAGDALAPADSAPFSISGPATTMKIALNGGQLGLNPGIQSAPFTINVQAVDGAGGGAAVLSDTNLMLSVKTGTGFLNGNFFGTISAGQSVAVFAGTANYTVAESNVVFTDTATSGDPLAPVDTVALTFNAPPAKLIVASISPAAPAAGEPFTVRVDAKDGLNNAAGVSSDTTIVLSLNTGTGTLGGISSGIMPAGTSTVSISGVIYSKAENGVVATATVTAGNPLPPVNSTPFNVITQTLSLSLNAGNNQSAAAGTAVTIPPSVIVKDGGGIPVSGIIVTFAVSGGGGTLVGPSRTTNAAGIAAVSTWTLGAALGANTLMATVVGAGGSPVTFSATAISAGGVTPLALSSGPLATPAAAGVGQLVQFSASANLNGSAFSWDFGDGMKDSSGSAAVSHAFTAPGTYTIGVIVVNGAQTVSGATALVVSAPTIGTGNDRNGNGFSDSVETAFGLDPADPNSSPVPPGTQTSALTRPKLSLKLNFARPASDSLALGGTLSIPAGFKVSGAKLGLAAGDLVQVFALDAKGKAKSGGNQAALSLKSKKGVISAQTSKFAIKLNKTDLAAAFVSSGLANASVNAAVTINLAVVLSQSDRLTGVVSAATLSLHYSAKKGKTGTAK